MKLLFLISCIFAQYTDWVDQNHNVYDQISHRDHATPPQQRYSGALASQNQQSVFVQRNQYAQKLPDQFNQESNEVASCGANEYTYVLELKNAKNQ